MVTSSLGRVAYIIWSECTTGGLDGASMGVLTWKFFFMVLPMLNFQSPFLKDSKDLACLNLKCQICISMWILVIA